MDISLVHQLASQGKVAIKKHAVLRMHQRRISSGEIEEVLTTGEIVEEYSADHRLPSALILGYTSAKRPLHIVVALEEEDAMIWVITVYEPTNDVWEVGYRKRRAK